VALYRDNCKVAQPMSSKRSTTNALLTAPSPAETVQHMVERAVSRPVRERMPRNRRSRTFEFRVADCKGFVTVGEYDDGRPGELFIRVSKQGSTLAGIMDAFAISVSHGLQYGVPLRAFVEAFVGMRFEPAGMTDDPDLRISTSIVDYLFRKLSLMYLDPFERGELNILSTDERVQPTLPGVEESVTETRQGMDMSPHRPPSESTEHRHVDIRATDAPLCMVCGNQMVRAGSCYACTDCGATSGCS
jgi:ribonucleoside-diphosphate reductase alpha chain